jgi:XTP/dITP diphosphohydrolase
MIYSSLLMTSLTQIVIATSNRGKLIELAAALNELNVELLTLKDFPGVIEAPEEGDSFAEIALQKATFYYEQIRLPVLAEDSGLVVPALRGFPGTQSARVANSDAERIRFVLDKLKSAQDRSAFFYCSMVFTSGDETIQSDGRCDGTITETPRGTLGFGYDPVFQPDGSLQTFGEMNVEEKANCSHRARALQMLLPKIKSRIQNNP